VVFGVLHMMKGGGRNCLFKNIQPNSTCVMSVTQLFAGDDFNICGAICVSLKSPQHYVFLAS